MKSLIELIRHWSNVAQWIGACGHYATTFMAGFPKFPTREDYKNTGSNNDGGNDGSGNA